MLLHASTGGTILIIESWDSGCHYRIKKNHFTIDERTEKENDEVAAWAWSYGLGDH